MTSRRDAARGTRQPPRGLDRGGPATGPKGRRWGLVVAAALGGLATVAVLAALFTPPPSTLPAQPPDRTAGAEGETAPAGSEGAAPSSGEKGPGPKRAQPKPPERPLFQAPATLEWTSALGPGGVTVPAPAPAEAFSRLVGAVFAGPKEIHFIGIREPGKPLLPLGDLLDAFVLAYRAREAGDHNTGVTIDPTPEQLARGLRDDDPMNVLYLGGVKGTVVGLDSCRGDLDLKVLGLGVDNATKKPVMCKVFGYRNMFDLLSALPAQEKQTWHRFWLEPAENAVRVSKDGSTFLLDTKLRARTQYMVPRDGKPVPAEKVANPAAEEFVGHITENLEAYADEFPSLRKLAAYAQLASLAEAVRPASQGKEPDDRPRPELNTAWLLDEHQPRAVETLQTTPALVVKKEVPVSGGTRTLMQSGGVDLGPGRNTYRKADPAAEAVQKGVLEAVRKSPGAVNRTVSVDGVDYQVVSVHLPRNPEKSARPEAGIALWQTDLSNGKLHVVREYPAPGATVSVGQGWGLRLPRVAFSAVSATVLQDGARVKLPRAVHLYEKAGAAVTLDRVGQVQIPGQPRARCYSDRSNERKLVVFRNELIYLEGKIDWVVSTPGGAPAMRLHPGSRFARFDGTAPYPVKEVSTLEGSTSYEYRDGKLVAIRGPGGEEVRLVWQGTRLARLTDAEGQALVDYRYRADGLLRAAVDREGRADHYGYEPGGELTGVWTDQPAEARAEVRTTGRFGVYPLLGAARLEELGGSVGPFAMLRCVREARAGTEKNTWEVVDYPGGSSRAIDPGAMEQALTRLQEARTTEAKKVAARDLLTALGPVAEGKKRVLAVGPNAEEIARSLTLAAGMDKVAGYGADAELAVANFLAGWKDPRRGSEEVRGPWLRRGSVLMHRPADPNDRAFLALERALKDSDLPEVPGFTVLLGHHSAEFESAGRALAEELQGGPVFAFTCGVGNSHAFAGELLIRCKATGVSYFAQHIEPDVVGAVLPAFLRHLAGEKNNANPHHAAQRALLSALEQLMEDARAGKIPEPVKLRGPDKVRELERKLEPFRGLLQRLGRRGGPGSPWENPVRLACAGTGPPEAGGGLLARAL